MALPALGPRRAASIPAPRAVPLPEITSSSAPLAPSKRVPARHRRSPIRVVGGWLLAIYLGITTTSPRSARITWDICVVGSGLLLALLMAGIGVLVLESDATTRH